MDGRSGMNPTEVITSALRAHRWNPVGTAGWCVGCGHGVCTENEHEAHVAAAIVAELKLTEEWGYLQSPYMKPFTHRPTVPPGYRLRHHFVTPWAPTSQENS